MRNAYNHRLRLVESVRQRGIKPTARLFLTSTLTVRKWWRRYQQVGPSGWQEHTRAPQHSPLKTSAAIEQQVLALRQKPCTGSKKMNSSTSKISPAAVTFWPKAHTYQLYFNLARPNSHKENHTPWQIIERLAPRSPLNLCLLPPVFLEYYLNDSGGYDVPRLP